MAATKTLKTYIAAGTSNAAGTTTTGSVLNHTTAYGGLVTAKIVNGGTAPTIVAQVNFYTSGDGTNFKLFGSESASRFNSITHEYSWNLPAGAMYSRVDVTGNTAQAVTCEAFCQELTTI